MICSVTHLKLKSIWSFPLFIFLNFFAFRQLNKVDGLIDFSSNATSSKDFWTKSVWKDRESMLNYVNNGAHLKAMKAFPKVADLYESKVMSWDCEEIPDWDEAMERNNNSNYEYLKSAAYKLTEHYRDQSLCKTKNV